MTNGTGIIDLRPDTKKDWALKHTIQILVRQRQEIDAKIKELRSLLPKQVTKISKSVKYEKNGKTFKLR